MTKNIIQKAIIDLHYSGNADGFVIQKEISDWCNLELGPGLEEILEKADTGATVRKIDRIELEINLGNKTDWLSQLSKEISSQLQRKLSELKSEADGSVQEHTKSQSFFEIFFYFLQKGYLPWSATFESRDEFSDALLSAIEEGLPGNIKKQLLQIISSPVARKRLVEQLNDKEWLHLVAVFYPDYKNEILALLGDVTTLLKIIPEERRKQVKSAFKQNVWQHAGNANARDGLREVAVDLAKEIYSFLDTGQREVYKKFHPTSIILDEAMGRVEKKAEESIFKQAEEAGEIKGEKDESASQVKKEPGDEQESETPPGTYIYINNAGLIILAPFLPAFFKKLDLAAEDKITDIDLAVNLVSYLATGTEYAAEFDLVLAKVLCGIDPSMPVSTIDAFTEEQKKEAGELLLSAIEYWGVLKDTSPDGLRESFLKREGKLSLINNEWILQVEQKPYDMLMQSLPWNINMILLPWMKQMLKTEMVTN